MAGLERTELSGYRISGRRSCRGGRAVTRVWSGTRWCGGVSRRWKPGGDGVSGRRCCGVAVMRAVVDLLTSNGSAFERCQSGTRWCGPRRWRPGRGWGFGHALVRMFGQAMLLSAGTCRHGPPEREVCVGSRHAGSRRGELARGAVECARTPDLRADTRGAGKPWQAGGGTRWGESVRGEGAVHW